MSHDFSHRPTGGSPDVTSPRLVVAGLGYVGLPLAVRAAEAGYAVTGVDTDAYRVKSAAAGDSYIEDIGSARLRAAVDSGRLRTTDEYAAAGGVDIGVITVPTPLRDGSPDLRYVEAAGRGLAPLLRPGALVVLESTSYPGTTEEVLLPVLEEGSGLRAGEGFHLGYSPERIDPGNPRWTLENTPKLVSGIDAASLAAVEEFYGHLVERTVAVSGPRTAELTKLLENTFRQVNIALINELALCARPLGVDIWEAVEAAATKPYGFMPFRPGPGVGGHCLPVDPAYLSWDVERQLGHDVRFISLAGEVNDRMPGHVADRVAAGLRERGKELAGARVLVLGLAYKANTGDLRESPALTVCALLRERGARLRAVDPYADPRALDSDTVRVPLTEEEVRAADAVLVLTDHDTFDYALVARCASYVFDARDRCPGPRTERL
ncbi:nucleotide sugar dehydrogenase [Streptomyces albidoflavus]|uniref:nucleotide sugar dehydrogenase n=1 Tax=Streptomyces albidoflavus TaxID=1886 RepID=UPI0038CF7F4A